MWEWIKSIQLLKWVFSIYFMVPELIEHTLFFFPSFLILPLLLWIHQHFLLIMAGTQSTLPITTVRSDQLIQFSHQVHTMLNYDNYLMWKSQVLPVLRGYDLVSVDGSGSIPSPMISINGVNTTNSAFAKWHEQNQLILT
jgi:hypothetical protein